MMASMHGNLHDRGRSGLGQAVARLLPQPPITRFAPSPTGYLHLGHVVNAIFVWGLARAAGGRVLLRLEDHDRVRCRPALRSRVPGGPGVAGFRARRRADTALAAERSRRALRTRAGAPGRRGSRLRLCLLAPGDRRRTIRRRVPRLAAWRSTPGHGLRVRIDDEPETAVDVRVGPLMQRPGRQCGDVLVRDRDGHWTYQFAVTVDDLDQDITLVIRGTTCWSPRAVRWR